MPHGTNANRFEVAQAIADLIDEIGPNAELTVQINMVGEGNCDWRIVPSPNKLTVTTPPKKDSWVKQKFEEANAHFTLEQVAAIERIARRIARRITDERIKRDATGFRNQASGLAIPTKEEDGD